MQTSTEHGITLTFPRGNLKENKQNQKIKQTNKMKNKTKQKILLCKAKFSDFSLGTKSYCNMLLY